MSVSASSLPDHKIVDLAIFEDESTMHQECSNGDYASCPAVRRIATALRYYSVLNILHNGSHLAIFENFIGELYPLQRFVNDYIHLLQQHEKQEKEIETYLVETLKLFKPCNVKTCKFTQRHQSVQQDEEMKDDVDEQDAAHLDGVTNFYKESFDGLHFCLFHLFDAGLRSMNSENDDNDEKEQEKQATNKYYDPKFARINEMISERKHITNSFGRFNTNHKAYKFSIDNKPQQTEGDTFLDELYKRLKQQKVNTSLIEKLHAFIRDEEFDTDSIDMDFADKNTGNVSQNLGDAQCGNQIHHMLRSANASTGSFAVGLRFYYWPYFKSGGGYHVEQEFQQNRLDHSGYEATQMYVTQKYGSFKEELLQYGLDFSIERYNDKVVVKAKALTKSKQVKKMRVQWYDAWEPSLAHYGVPRWTILAFSNLVAVTLYTDFSELSADFSSTFRKSHPFESLSDIKRRNREYWWWSKILRETVELYGQKNFYGLGKPENGKFHGPFYCGMSSMLKMPEFVVRFNGPTSTSMYEEVARNFAKQRGIIIQLQNTINVRGLDCSWISRYREEAERLFFGGYWPMQIESILVMGTNSNLRPVIETLVSLDKIINGGSVQEENVDVALLSSLIAAHVFGERKAEIDGYISSTFEHYVQSKEILNLNLDRLYNTKSKNKKTLNLVMHSLKQQREKYMDLSVCVNRIRAARPVLADVIDEEPALPTPPRTPRRRRSSSSSSEEREMQPLNLFKPILLSIFSNAHSLHIQTSYLGLGSLPFYPFSWLALLDMLKETEVREVIVMANAKKTERSWIDIWFEDDAYSVDREMVIKEYEIENYRIQSLPRVDVAGFDGYLQHSRHMISKKQSLKSG